MINSVKNNMNQLYALRAQNNRPLESYAVEDIGKEKNPIILSSQLNKPVTISGEAFSAVLTAQEHNSMGDFSSSSSDSMVKTGDGYVDLDEYFSNDHVSQKSHNLLEGAKQLLLPSGDNIKAITAHVETRFKELLSEYNIPAAPAQITYNNSGEMKLPSDYPYADELVQALEMNPGLTRELSTLNALSSHAAGIERSMAFSKEYSQASSQNQIDAIIEKYSDLFSGGSHNWHIALNFSEEGDLTITKNDEAFKFL